MKPKAALILGMGPQFAFGLHGFFHAHEHLQAAATGGNDAHTHFHQAHVKLRVADHTLAGHGQFTTAAEGQVEGRGNGGEWRVGEQPRRVLQAPGGFLDQIELLVLGGH